jgi:polysaccharide deacetylase family protein (PEP-CTERM system associated)
LGEHEVAATFYVLGWVADRYPNLVRTIASAGHELASHSYWHRLVYQMSPADFRADLRRSKHAIEDAAGVSVSSFRAPSFSVTEKSIWALNILVEEGFTCDSSIFPIVHDRYGIPGAERKIHRIDTEAGSLWEFPPTVARILKADVPVSGGGYFRLYPLAFTVACLSQINQLGHPCMFYIHPWEVDPDQMRMPFARGMTRFRHYINLRSTYDKMDRLLDRFSFGSVADVLQEYDQHKTQEALCGT